MLPRVPGGVYRLLIDVDAGAFQPGAPVPADEAEPLHVTVRVVRHVDSALNFWLAFLALLPYPIWRSLVDRAHPAPDAAKP